MDQWLNVLVGAGTPRRFTLWVNGRFWRKAVVGRIAYLGYVRKLIARAARAPLDHFDRSCENWLFVFNSNFLRAKEATGPRTDGPRDLATPTADLVAVTQKNSSENFA